MAGWCWRGELGRIWLAASLLLPAGASRDAAAAPTAAGAAETPDTAPPEQISAFTACSRRAKLEEILLDTASRRLHQTVCGASLWFDGLFGARDLDAALNSSGRIELATAYSEFTGSRTRLRFNVRTRLPAMERRLSAFVGIDDEDDFVRDRSEDPALRSRSTATDRDEFLAGLGFGGVTTDTFQSDFKVGVRNVSLPKAFVQNRFSYIPYSLERNRVLLRITPFWNNRDGFGLTTSTSFDHIMEEAFLMRWGTAATITEETAGLDWRTAIVLYQNLHLSSGLAYEAFVRGVSGAAEPLGAFGFRTVYRRPLFRGSLIGEVVVGYSWPRDDPALERAGAADFGVGVEMPFGRGPG